MGVWVCRRAHKEVVHPDAENGYEDDAQAHDEGNEACSTKVDVQILYDIERGRMKYCVRTTI